MRSTLGPPHGSCDLDQAAGTSRDAELARLVSALPTYRGYLGFQVLMCLAAAGSSTFGPTPLSYARLSRLVGRQRPQRLPGRPTEPNAAVKRAAVDLKWPGEHLKWSNQYRRPNVWAVTKPAHFQPVGAPRWSLAPVLIGRLARQQSIYGPTADTILMRLAVAVDEDGSLSATRAELASATDVGVDQAMLHLHALARERHGVIQLEKLRPLPGTRAPLWRLQLAPIPERPEQPIEDWPEPEPPGPSQEEQERIWDEEQVEDILIKVGEVGVEGAREELPPWDVHRLDELLASSPELFGEPANERGARLGPQA